MSQRQATDRVRKGEPGRLRRVETREAQVNAGRDGRDAQVSPCLHSAAVNESENGK